MNKAIKNSTDNNSPDNPASAMMSWGRLPVKLITQPESLAVASGLNVFRRR